MASVERKPGQDIWQQHLETHRRAIADRKPDALANLQLEMDKLELEAAGIVGRMDLAARNFPLRQERDRKRHEASMTALDRRLDEIRRKMGDLGTLKRKDGKKRTMLDNDTGRTPERGQHAEDHTIDTLTPELARAADDLREGYRVRLGGMMAGAGRYEPRLDHGQDGPGRKARTLEERYSGWVSLMGASRAYIRWIIDIFCEGDQTIGSTAQAFRVEPAKVIEGIRYGLQLYADHYPPLDSRERSGV